VVNERWKTNKRHASSAVRCVVTRGGGEETVTHYQSEAEETAKWYTQNCYRVVVAY
jgi:N-acetyl-beta-hexosaminidase